MAVTLAQVRRFMKLQLDADKQGKSISASGATLEEALHDASIQLGIPVKKIIYEVIQKGKEGLFKGSGTQWKIIAYTQAEKGKGVDIFEEDLGLDGDFELGLPSASKNRDGRVCVRRQSDGIYMKTDPPKGIGKRATKEQAVLVLSQKRVDGYDDGLVDRIVKRADGNYVKIASYNYNPANDPVMSVSVVDIEMKAYLMIQQPGQGGSDIDAETIKAFLNNNRVVFGINEETLQDLEDNPVYNEDVLVASGVKPRNGNDASVVYNFKTDHSVIDFKEKNGKVDFKELNLIENVVAGQQLAKKVPAEQGQMGHTVTGKTLPAKSGKDINIPVGKNVKLSEDGTTAISEINGQVIVISGKINVEPVYTVASDVNLHTGNILFLGTVIIKGNVEDGFSVKAAGNIEVSGNVGKAILDAEGDIIVHQGILGKNEGKVKCGRNLYAKFIEHAHVEAEENVIVSDGILHSMVDSNKKIICQGRRASIVGGQLRAAEEINAKNLGSVAGAETILEVGYDPQRKQKLVFLQQKHDELSKEMEELDRNITTIENLKKVQKQLPEEKQKYYDELNEKKIKALTQINIVQKEIEEIKTYLSSLKIKGKISASERVFPGVKICLRDVTDKVRVEQKSVTYLLEGKRIRMTKYEPAEGDYQRRR
ncbi:MAG: FapA family protein [Spirochaetales bacterium]|nr:FapA family protein [Spirochaetales bacterium]